MKIKLPKYATVCGNSVFDGDHQIDRGMGGLTVFGGRVLAALMRLVEASIQKKLV